uniref:1,4-dihydroxy-2-naphthoate octaprenyltransferase n=1 Tax=Polaribacter sp. TaxID=1920175 RepID=UPI0040472F7B
MSTIKNYIQAARLRTLPLSISGIVVGSFLAKAQQEFQWEICVLALLATIGFQILSNFANDYGDGIKGTDDQRTGEKRLVASGQISPKQMKRAIIITIICSLIISIALIYVAFGKDEFLLALLFFGLGVASIVAAIKYTVGKSAYGYSGFGDVFVFVFFGLLSVVGSYFLFVKQLHFDVFLPAFSIGLLSTAVLNLNNMRDRENDEKVGKNTLVVKMGQKTSKRYHFTLLFFALITATMYAILHYHSPVQFLFLIAFIPLLKHVIFVSKNRVPALLDGELKKVALSTFLFGILFGLSFVI